MPQWIKIQSLFGNKQHTEHPAYTWVLYSESPRDFRWQQTGCKEWPKEDWSNHRHRCFLVSWISTLTLSHPLCGHRDQERGSPDWDGFQMDLCCMLRCSTTPHQQGAQQQTLGEEGVGGQRFPVKSASGHRLKGIYKEGGKSFKSTSLIFFPNHIIWCN